MPDFAAKGDKVPKGAMAVSLLGATPVMGQQPVPQRGGGGGPGFAQVSPAQTPRGAQTVPLAGAQLGQASLPQPVLGTPRQSGGTDSYPVRMEGIGPDGTRLKAEYDYVFPKGTKITFFGMA